MSTVECPGCNDRIDARSQYLNQVPGMFPHQSSCRARVDYESLRQVIEPVALLEDPLVETAIRYGREVTINGNLVGGSKNESKGKWWKAPWDEVD